MTRLILVRHGNTFEAGQTPVQVGAKTDLPLTAQGRKQAEEVARFLIRKQIEPAVVLAGKLKRQAESAEIIARMLGKSALSDGALTEIDYGPWEGLAAEEIARKWPKEYAAWTEEGRWAEGIFGGTADYFVSGLKQWLKELEKVPGTVVAVTSNGTLRFFHSLQSGRAGDPKVKTGHFCDIQLSSGVLSIACWNMNPSGL